MDKRAAKTLESVYKALSGLLKEKDYAAIKVGEILERSGISRGAFYAHFHDKDEVLSSFCDRLFEQVFTLGCGNGSPDPSKTPDSRPLLNHLALNFYEKREMISPILSSSGRAVFVNRLVSRSSGIMEKCVFSHELYKEGVPEKLQALQLTDSFVSIVCHWIMMGCLSSPETLIGYFYILHQ